MREFKLHSLKDKIQLISSVQCDYFVEGCITALENQKYKSGVILEVEAN